jgi:uncharacterized protein (DUF433 family)
MFQARWESHDSTQFRIAVDLLALLAAGATREEILEDYPLLEAGDITAALEYAARQSDHPMLRVA